MHTISTPTRGVQLDAWTLNDVELLAEAILRNPHAMTPNLRWAKGALDAAGPRDPHEIRKAKIEAELRTGLLAEWTAPPDETGFTSWAVRPGGKPTSLVGGVTLWWAQQQSGKPLATKVAEAGLFVMPAARRAAVGIQTLLEAERLAFSEWGADALELTTAGENQAMLALARHPSLDYEEVGPVNRWQVRMWAPDADRTKPAERGAMQSCMLFRKSARRREWPR